MESIALCSCRSATIVVLLSACLPHPILYPNKNTTTSNTTITRTSGTFIPFMFFMDTLLRLTPMYLVREEFNKSMEDEFVSFVRGTQEPGVMATHMKRDARDVVVAKPLLAKIPKIVWLIVGALVVFAVIFWLYYSRRKQTTNIQKQNDIKVVMGQVKDLQNEIDTLQQKQTAMMGHLRNVASHSQSVESTLSQALADWTKTFDQLRSEIEIVDGEAEEQDEAGEEEAEGDGEGHEDEDEEDDK